MYIYIYIICNYIGPGSAYNHATLLIRPNL